MLVFAKVLSKNMCKKRANEREIRESKVIFAKFLQKIIL
jgi:hypothetical protein